MLWNQRQFSSQRMKISRLSFRVSNMWFMINLPTFAAKRKHSPERQKEASVMTCEVSRDICFASKHNSSSLLIDSLGARKSFQPEQILTWNFRNKVSLFISIHCYPFSLQSARGEWRFMEARIRLQSTSLNLDESWMGAELFTDVSLKVFGGSFFPKNFEPVLKF